MNIPQASFLTPAEFCRGPDLLRPGSLTGRNVDPCAVAFIYTMHPYDGDEADLRVPPEDHRLIFWPAAMGHEMVADREPILRAMFGPDYREATKNAAYGDGYDSVDLRRLAVLLALLDVSHDGLVTMANSEQWWVKEWRAAGREGT